MSNFYTNTALMQDPSKSLASKLVLCLSSNSTVETSMNSVAQAIQLLQQLCTDEASAY